MLSILLTAGDSNVYLLAKGSPFMSFLSDRDICINQLTQTSSIVVVLSGTEAVSGFADSLQGFIFPRTIVRATKAFLLGNSWFGSDCGYWWRRGCSSLGGDYGAGQSKSLN